MEILDECVGEAYDSLAPAVAEWLSMRDDRAQQPVWERWQGGRKASHANFEQTWQCGGFKSAWNDVACRKCTSTIVLLLKGCFTRDMLDGCCCYCQCCQMLYTLLQLFLVLKLRAI